MTCLKIDTPVFGSLLCCADFSDRSLLAWEKAVGLARQNRAELSLLHVLFHLLPGSAKREKEHPGGGAAESAAEVKQRLKEQYISLAPDLKCRLFVRMGQPTVEILAHLEEHPVDLVVMGSEGLSGLGLTLLGSVAERVLRQSGVSCLIVR